MRTVEVSNAWLMLVSAGFSAVLLTACSDSSDSSDARSGAGPEPDYTIN